MKLHKSVIFIFTVFFFVFSLTALAHGGGKSCKSSLFDYKEMFNISSDEISIIKGEFVKILDNGDAYYCPSGDQSTSISKKIQMCATVITSNVFNKQRVPSKKLTTKIFDATFGGTHLNLRHLSRCRMFVAHKIKN